MVLVAALIAACGPSATPTAEPLPEPTEAPAEPEPTEAPADEPAESGDIAENVGIVAYPGDLASLDPPYMLSGDTNIGFNAYETLTLWRPDQGVVPVLATSWESNEDATEWTFTLREGVTFHDGTALTAEDVKASLDRNIEVGMVAYDFIGVESIEVVDDLTVRFICSDSRDMPLILSAGYGMFIYSAEAAQQSTEWFAEGRDAGTGPYTIESFESGQQLVLTRYEDYWGGWEEGQFTKVIYRIVEDPTVRDQMIRSGEADITLELPYDSLESVGALEDVTLVPMQPLAHMVAGFDLNNPPLDNVQVRQALAYSFPYEDVHQGVFLGYGSRGGIGFGPSSLWDPPADFPRYELDIDRAAELLMEAGYEDGFELTVTAAAGYKEVVDTLNLWQAQLAKLGIELKIEQLSAGPFWDAAYNPDNEEYDVFVVPASGDVPSPWSWLICYTSSPLGWLPFVGYNNPEFDELVFDAWALEATDPDAANELWVEAQRILYEDAASIFIMDTPSIYAMGDDIIGFEPNPPYSADVIFWHELKRQ
jgi:peptide/nickel transport system substrate-binding protein